MCGRYYLYIEEAELQEIFRELTEDKQAFNTGEIFPTNHVPVLCANGPRVMKWGFSRNDAKGHIINARSETIREKAIFYRPLQEGRCLVPASWYYEWETIGSKKQKYAISHPDMPLLFMAGLYRYEPNAATPSFVILTREAAKELAFIHDRMPVILPHAQQLSWLNGDTDALICDPGTFKYQKEQPPGTEEQQQFLLET